MVPGISSPLSQYFLRISPRQIDCLPHHGINPRPKPLILKDSPQTWQGQHLERRPENLPPTRVLRLLWINDGYLKETSLLQNIAVSKNEGRCLLSWPQAANYQRLGSPQGGLRATCSMDRKNHPKAGHETQGLYDTYPTTSKARLVSRPHSPMPQPSSHRALAPSMQVQFRLPKHRTKARDELRMRPNLASYRQRRLRRQPTAIMI
jgi:hypothetical protein